MLMPQKAIVLKVNALVWVETISGQSTTIVPTTEGSFIFGCKTCLYPFCFRRASGRQKRATNEQVLTPEEAVHLFGDHVAAE